MPQFNARAVLTALCIGSAAAANAAPSLLGDTISFLRAYPTTTTQFGPSIPETTVAAGVSDAVTWSYITIDPEADRIFFKLPDATSFGGSGLTFDGFVIGGLDHDIASVSVLSNTTGFDIEVKHTLRSIEVNLNNPSPTYKSGDWVIGVQLSGPVSNVPEIESASMLSLGLLAMFVMRRRRSA